MMGPRPCRTVVLLALAAVSAFLGVQTARSWDGPQQPPGPGASQGVEPASPMGDFRLRSFARASHPDFRRRNPGDLSMAAIMAGPCGPVEPGKIHRFVAGVDRCVVPMTDQEIRDELNDPFAAGVLRKGMFPEGVAEIAAAVAASAPGLALSVYVVGEGGQVPTSVAPRDAPRDLRYVLTWGANPQQSEILLSAAPGGRSGFLQVIAWDAGAGQYNFYEFRPLEGPAAAAGRVWSWAGDSATAATASARGRGCFDCHHNGVVVMKELSFPWNNWHSEAAQISPLVVPVAVADEAFFQRRVDFGAQLLEQAVRNGTTRYYRGWLRDRAQRDAGGTVRLKDVGEMLRRLTTNTTVNFASSPVQSDGAQTSPPGRDIVGVPADVLLWDSVLGTLLGLEYRIPDLAFGRAAYDQYLREHHFKLVQAEPPGYEKPGSTYFAYFAPVPAAEDRLVAGQLRSAGIVTDKFIAALAMVDFRNPVFSEKRASLQAYADRLTAGAISGGVSSVPGDFAALVRAAAASQPAGAPGRVDSWTPEQQFLYTWELPDAAWKQDATARIQAYLDELGALAPADRMDRLMRLADLRRSQFQNWPRIGNLDEFSLLLPRSDLLP